MLLTWSLRRNDKARTDGESLDHLYRQARRDQNEDRVTNDHNLESLKFHVRASSLLP